MHKLLGIKFLTGGKKIFLKELEKSLKNGEQNFAVTPNPEIMLASSKNPELKKILEEAKWNLPDGFGIVIGGFIEENFKKIFGNGEKKLSGIKNFFYQIKKFFLFFYFFGKFFLLKIFGKKGISPIKKRICGSDIFYDICKLAEKNNFGIYLIGGAKGVPQKVEEKLKKLYPKIKIFGTFDGNFGNEKEIFELEKNLQKTNPEIIFVAMGSPKQEILIKKFFTKNKKILFGIGIGGTFDFVIGKQKRAPKIMQKMGLEWLFRLYKEPKRFGRIWDATFGYLTMLYKNL
ncbi:WecB/TagA/CpsF family glycosyltransferase [Candidatus Gracilibacteria bacterium]|nr:WecB/TagA/CpsF family glycosyltransferase [Candidatus Gracilibacteria bacterium]